MIKKLIWAIKNIIPYLWFGIWMSHISGIWRLSKQYGNYRGIVFFNSIANAFKHLLPSMVAVDLVVGLIGALVLRLIVYAWVDSKKDLRSGREFGGARWAKAKEMDPIRDKNFFNNVILTNTEWFSLTGKGGRFGSRNRNVLIIGGSGSGKTRYWLKPNLLQMHSSYVITDPKGTVIRECGKALAENGYIIKCFDTINFARSMHYNPFEYIRKEEDILLFVDTLMKSTKGEGKDGESFWLNAERLLYCALIGYIYYEAPKEEQNLITLLEFLNAIEVREDDEDYKCAVDLMFDALERKNPDHFAVRQWKKYKQSAGKTAKSILISCGARLSPFDLTGVREVMEYDELQLDQLGDHKIALFLTMSDTNTTFRFLLSLIYSQMINILSDKAYDEYGGELPIPVRFLMDEVANIGEIAGLDNLTSVVRSRNMSLCLFLQSLEQLKTNYGESKAKTIIGNMDSKIFLGGGDDTTLKELSESLGKETIRYFTQSESEGSSPSSSKGESKVGRELITVNELENMPSNKCILRFKNSHPFYSDKYDLTKHPNYKLTSDYDPKNAFDPIKYHKHKMRLKLSDEYHYVEIK